MLINKKKIIFIHIEKTGGNSLTNLLSKYSGENKFRRKSYQDLNNTFELKGKFTKDKHQKIKDYKKLLKNQFKKYKIITIVRNPFERLISFYFGIDGNTKINPIIRNYNKFHEFFFGKFFFINTGKYIRPKLTLEKFKKFVKLNKCQSDYIKINSNFYKPHFLIKFENYNNDVQKICRKLNIEYKKIHVNKSPYKPSDKWLLRDLENIVYDSHHKEDYKRFKYKKIY
jgi:hypothetical protein